MEVGKQEAATNQEIHGFPVVKAYKYLGVWLSSSTKEVVSHALASVCKTFNKIKFRARALSVRAKLRVISTFILGKLIYQALPLYSIGTLKSENVEHIYKQMVSKLVGISKNAQYEDIFDLFGLSKIREVLGRIQQMKADQDSNEGARDLEIEQISKEAIQRQEVAKAFTGDHIQLVNWTSPVWITNGRRVQCRKHKCPFGREHLCDAKLEEIGVPRNLEEVMVLTSTQAKMKVAAIRNRVKEI